MTTKRPWATPKCQRERRDRLCLVPMLEADNGIVRIAHDDHVASGATLPPLVGPLIIDVMEKSLQASGAKTLRAIAAALNERGIKTPRGPGEWDATKVRRVLARL